MELILSCIRNVENSLGNHYKENVYQNALCIELNLSGFIVQSEVIVPITYRGMNIGYERADIVVYSPTGVIICILELKSQTTRLSLKEINQLRKYILNLNTYTGFLINFNTELEIIQVDLETYTKI